MYHLQRFEFKNNLGKQRIAPLFQYFSTLLLQ